MKTKLSSEFLYNQQKNVLNKQIRRMILWAFLSFISVSMLISLLRFDLSGDKGMESNLFDAVYVCFDKLVIIADGIFSVIFFCGLIIELYEIFVSCFFIRQFKKNNYAIHTIGQWYEVCCGEKWFGYYRMKEYEL